MSIEIEAEVNTHPDPQRSQWNAIYAGSHYHYGYDAGPVARRAVRYSRPLIEKGSNPSALDVGCGEGQDVAFLCESGYRTTGLDFIPEAIEKAQRLLEVRHMQALLHAGDLRDWNWVDTYDLVLAVNSLQFLGKDAPPILERVRQSVAINGVLGFSIFACDEGSEVRNGVFFIAHDDLLSAFDCHGHNRSWQMLETTKLWQWNTRTNSPQPFITLIAQRLK